eukprot:CAMPEP_0177500594 /NCGR_PEP_ID=MMETSP0369-20130122/36757_1 /TAXON_ID=447022 ORGANISM="Scrippsiella hangoei-like, Strain SHHI-4" /NCGR_SAMPLE_ID=MMETSP0369 /ASSEMBLY_ACC=CAM_ASM_000364 /LENGTH=124 /DNA_ID=CAMNT_0018978009 /DNA_START=150 /DNA_END=522 /DNA_ORIENTATION=-
MALEACNVELCKPSSDGRAAPDDGGPPRHAQSDEVQLRADSESSGNMSQAKAFGVSSMSRIPPSIANSPATMQQGMKRKHEARPICHNGASTSHRSTTQSAAPKPEPVTSSAAPKSNDHKRMPA